MTVVELRAALADHPDDMDVMIVGGGWDACEVEGRGATLMLIGDIIPESGMKSLAILDEVRRYEPVAR